MPGRLPLGEKLVWSVLFCSADALNSGLRFSCGLDRRSYLTVRRALCRLVLWLGNKAKQPKLCRLLGYSD
jgi:hypothetical protein